MKVSHALLRLTILTHALSMTTTLTNVEPPVIDGYVEAKLIQKREPDLPQVNGADLALQERGVDNSDIESRQIGIVIAAVAFVSTVVVGVVLAIVFSIEADNPRREAYTQNAVSEMYGNNSNTNYVVCHPEHTFSFDGIQGTDWNHLHHEVPISFGRTIGYEIYWFRSGTFTRGGDGGYINWAYIGNVISSDGGTVVFGTP